MSDEALRTIHFATNAALERYADLIASRERYSREQLEDFVRESNRIEGIVRDPYPVEVSVTAGFLLLPEVRVRDMENLVNVFAPGARLRSKEGMNVRIRGADWRPPPGGPYVRTRLARLLDVQNPDPWLSHVEYESLHPFQDGNGRSGRALWVWHMLRAGQDPFSLPVLHLMYYQALEGARRI